MLAFHLLIINSCSLDMRGYEIGLGGLVPLKNPFVAYRLPGLHFCRESYERQKNILYSLSYKGIKLDFDNTPENNNLTFCSIKFSKIVYEQWRILIEKHSPHLIFISGNSNTKVSLYANDDGNINIYTHFSLYLSNKSDRLFPKLFVVPGNIQQLKDDYTYNFTYSFEFSDLKPDNLIKHQLPKKTLFVFVFSLIACFFLLKYIRKQTYFTKDVSIFKIWNFYIFYGNNVLFGILGINIFLTLICFLIFENRYISDSVLFNTYFVFFIPLSVYIRSRLTCFIGEEYNITDYIASFILYIELFILPSSLLDTATSIIFKSLRGPSLLTCVIYIGLSIYILSVAGSFGSLLCTVKTSHCITSLTSNVHVRAPNKVLLLDTIYIVGNIPISYHILDCFMKTLNDDSMLDYGGIFNISLLIASISLFFSIIRTLHMVQNNVPWLNSLASLHLIHSILTSVTYLVIHSSIIRLYDYIYTAFFLVRLFSGNLLIISIGNGFTFLGSFAFALYGLGEMYSRGRK